MLSQVSGERNLVVVHFKDGKLRKGYTHDFTPAKETFHLTSEEEGNRGSICEIRSEELKAVFFVKTLEGNRDYVEKKRFDEVDMSRLRGLKIKVEFLDGETIRGVSLGYSKGRKGFFVIPVDPDGNNERIYVVADSVRGVKLGSAAER